MKKIKINNNFLNQSRELQDLSEKVLLLDDKYLRLYSEFENCGAELSKQWPLIERKFVDFSEISKIYQKVINFGSRCFERLRIGLCGSPQKFHKTLRL